MDSQRDVGKPELERTTERDIHEAGDSPTEVETKPQNTDSISTTAVETNEQTGSNYITGIRFWLIMISLALSLFLTSLEIPIVTTSLVSITNDLGQFENVGWVISSYLLGYVGFLVIFAKLSDIFGRKLLFCIAISTFIIFSAACGAAQTLTQLIILRAFQGVGGAGCFALSTAILTELVPLDKLTQYVANLSSVYAISLLLGPIIGGAISSRDWRWIFLLNIPAGVPALLFALTAIPRNFPFHGQSHPPNHVSSTGFSKGSLRKLDILGAILLFLATLSLTAGFEEADSRFPWRSAYVISLLSVSGVLWIALILWERLVTKKDGVMEPVLPSRFFQDRVIVSILLNAILLGGPWFVGVFQLPQRFQVVHGSSGLRAGIQTMPFTFSAPFGSVTASTLANRVKLPAIFIVLISAVLQTIGFALLATLPDSANAIPDRIYGYQIIAGFGCGMNISTLILIIPFVAEYRDKAVGLGAVTQLRVMGGAIVLAIATSAFNSYTRPRLAQVFGTSHHMGSPIYSANEIHHLDPAEQLRVREILAHGYNTQMIVLAAFAAAQIPTTFLMWRKKQIMV